MIKILFVLNLLWSTTLFAQDFEGCGVYVFKGVLREDKYIVNEGTKSEMVFELADNQDFLNLSVFLNEPSTFKGRIIKQMDGTRGLLKGSSEISKRFPNPLDTSADIGITKIKSSVCEI